MDKKQILLVQPAETFMVNAIKDNLVKAGFRVETAKYTTSSVGNAVGDSLLIILYTDADVETHDDVLVYLKDLCLEDNRRIIIIGERVAFDFAHKFIPKEDIAFELPRPLDMQDLVEKALMVTSDEYEQQRRKCILIIDDDPTFLQMMREMLKVKYRVGMANSGAQAISWLTSNHADLILLDYDMPVLDGPKVMEMLKQESFSSDIPVMFLTGKNDRESVTSVLSLKPVDYLLKSISKPKLLSTLDKFFKSREN